MREVDRGNPWGLTVLEVRIWEAVMQHGEHQLAAAALGMDLRSVDNAVWRARQKMGVATKVHQVAKWVTWKLEQAAGRPRTAWVCMACSGLGFTVRRPA